MKPRIYLLFTLFWFAWIVALGLWLRNYEVGKIENALRPAYEPGTARTVGGPQ